MPIWDLNGRRVKSQNSVFPGSVNLIMTIY